MTSPYPAVKTTRGKSGSTQSRAGLHGCCGRFEHLGWGQKLKDSAGAQVAQRKQGPQLAPSVTAWVHIAFPEPRQIGRTISPTTTAAHDAEERFSHIDGDDRRKAAGHDLSSGDPVVRRASAIGAAGWAVATAWAGWHLNDPP